MNNNLKFLLIFFLLSLIPASCVFSKSAGPEPEAVVVGPRQSDPLPGHLQEKEDSFFSVQVDKLNDQFFARIGINSMAVFLLIRLIYFRSYRRKELFFTFFIFNFVIFLITYLLNKVEMGLGAAFGLFAVFSMLRYRTENIDTKDMTYLFLSIAIGLITAIAKASALELCILNAIILFVTFLLEGGLLLKREMTKKIQYEYIEFIKPENHGKLIDDLRARTGLDIHRISIGSVDFLKDTAEIRIFYSEKRGVATSPQGNSVPGNQ